MRDAGWCGCADRKRHAKADPPDDDTDHKYNHPLDLGGEQSVHPPYQAGGHGFTDAGENRHSEHQRQAAQLDRQD